MNHIVITKISDLQEVINASLDFSQKKSLTDFHNMWALTLDNDLVKKIKLDDLKRFLNELLHNRRLQIFQKDPTAKAKFYLWFDEQALQLRFNILFDISSPLPFGCNLDIVATANHILEEFLSCTYKIATEGQTFELCDTDEDNDEDDSNNYVLKVYVELLQNNKI